jgi:predicted alpha/beta-hydrolase family hydrolase
VGAWFHDEMQIETKQGFSVSALLDVPDNADLLYVLAHGAGAGMRHPFMQTIAEA